ncbi:IS30 family transposase [Candidatus Saccharibacteria bacterium]|nr:MAG: IS30 family transposase [Candidatus Saccharibacteria bacterium]
MSYRHLISDDRVVIATLLQEHRNQSYIASRIGVNRSAISRELARNKTRDKPVQIPLPKRPTILDKDCRHARGSGLAQDKYEAGENYCSAVREVHLANRFYEPRSAQRAATTRRLNANQSRLRLAYQSGDWLEQYVRHRLLKNEWSPEQIAGGLRRNYGIVLHWQTIYDYIDLCSNKTDKKQLQKHLRRGGRPYRHHGTNERIKARQKALPPIQSRDAVIEQRTRLGDFEGDTIVGLDTRDRIATHVDRTSGSVCSG